MGVSDSERLVMEALWTESPLSAEAIVDQIASDQGWTAATVKTLLNRLLKKKAITAKKDGRRYLYSPLISRQDYIETESQGFLDRLFEGRLAPLVSHFSDRKALSKEDIEDLKKLIGELDDDD